MPYNLLSTNEKKNKPIRKDDNPKMLNIIDIIPIFELLFNCSILVFS
jgi:hypothetical protein